ncbi:hypothetical protein GO755_14135 [Spirosoma sp. HMF4905]|uniref:Uncharacterized protein n=1 Tax=Spirosoma arboris TaxID=2682092 RepID=A0A7K1SBJ0_9BACT|nr:BT4734/BF3469 family protein [Spirosoma arboris]MVM31177.1 hypothetical protein [Spirosoma arboris]
MATYLDTREALNVEVSCFANYNTPGNPKPVNLYLWLINAKYRDRVLTIRAESDKLKRDALKATLPAITPSGVFTYRQASSLVPSGHSGFIQFDIDFKDNPHIRNYANLKAQLAKLPFVAYCGLSVSGTGYWGLVPIAHPERHGQHFDALFRVFAHYKIRLDDKPRNVASLRGYSYDPDGYFAEKVMLFELYDEPQPVATREFAPTADADTERQRVEVCIGEISKRNIDITSGYNNWYAIGCDIASTFGENGRDYFHIISQCHPEYQTVSCDKQYTHCLRSYKEVQLKTFFCRCRDSGITWKELLPYEPPERTTLLKNKSETSTLPTYKTYKSLEETDGRILVTVRETEPVNTRVDSQLNQRTIKLPKSLLYKWSLFGHPPLWWNKIAAHKALQRCLEPDDQAVQVVTNITTPVGVIKPIEDQIERLVVEPCDSYPAEWDEPNPPDAVPTIKPLSFFEWQRQNPSFSQLGLAL